MPFEEFFIDSRILKAIRKIGWSNPTNVQKQGLPDALNGKDLLIQSKTGSGKTAVYAISILEHLLRRFANEELNVTSSTIHSSKENVSVSIMHSTEEKKLTLSTVRSIEENITSTIHSIVIVPSQELCNQVYNCFYELSQYSRRYVSLVNLVDDTIFEELIKNAKTQQSQTTTLNNNQTTLDIVIGTPCRMLKYFNVMPNRNKVLAYLKQVVFDEADMFFGYGYEEEIKQLIDILSSGNNHKSQAMVVSATLNVDIDELCAQILDDPISIKPDESSLPSELQLLQYVVRCERNDKFLILYALIKLSLLKGRFIIFADDIQTAFKLKLFLETFKIYSCVLNNELPFNSRYDIVQYFNSGKLDILIATDQSSKFDSDKEYNCYRGIDFVKVDNIINFDFPTSVKSYIHRAGRTARASASGIALSLVSPYEASLLQNINLYLTKTANQKLRPFSFKVDIVEGFRYRVDDALFSLNKNKINAARRAEIKYELLNSQKLDEHFKKNPNDRVAIKHDFYAKTNIRSSLNSMGFVPHYLIPSALQANASTIPSAIRTKGAVNSKAFKRVRRSNPLKTLRR